jgi:peptidoglycan/LPS O-acetylase OafA/YrhL
MALLLTQQEVNRKRLRAAFVGVVLAVLGAPFIYRWVGSAPAPDTLDLVVGGFLVAAGGVFLGAAGVNRLGRHWWADITEEDEPLRPI